MERKVRNVKELIDALGACEGAAEATRIVLADGDYCLGDSLRFGARHQNVTLCGNGRVRLIGARRVNSYTLAKDRNDAYLRLNREARDRICVVNLRLWGVEDVGEFHSRGYGRKIVPSHAEVFVNETRMTVAQYPKKGEYLRITGCGDPYTDDWEDTLGHKEAGFDYDSERPEHWMMNDNIWVHGYWCWDWANSCERVRSIDLEKRRVLTAPEYAVTDFRVGQRFYFYNILEEVTQPGEAYIDPGELLLYFYPADAKAIYEIYVSTLEAPLAELRGARNVRFEGLEFCMTRGMGAYAEDADGVVFDNCLFQNIGNCAAKLVGGRGNWIRNSTIRCCGDGGVVLIGGDRRTLTGADSGVYNTHIHHVAQWSRCYQTAINASGVGITLAHNLIHDCPHIGILWAGNDFAIEHNELYSVCMETGDAGAIYAGRDLTFRGNSVSHNYIHHLGGVGLGTMGIYNDDGLSGTRMENNFFLEVGRAAFMGGGVDFLVRNNVFVKCYPAVSVDSRGSHEIFFWQPRMRDGLRANFYDAIQDFANPEKRDPDAKIDASQGVYLEKYPELAKIDEMFRQDIPMDGSAAIERNVFCSKMRFRYYWDQRNENHKQLYDDGKPVTLSPKDLAFVLDSRQDLAMEWSPGRGNWRFEKNYTARPDEFEDAEWGLLDVKRDSRAYVYGYRPNAMKGIGLIAKRRAQNPPLVRTKLTSPLSGKLEVTLTIRNDSHRRVRGTVTLFASDCVPLSRPEITFRLAPGGSTSCVVADVTSLGLSLRLGGDVDYQIEARSDLAGVRPSRL